MRKTIFLALLFCCTSPIFAQDLIIDTLENKNIYIKNGDYEAVIFDSSNYKITYIFPEGKSQKEKDNYIKRRAPWTPSIEDVEEAETLIKEYLVKQKVKVCKKVAQRNAKEKRLEKRNIDKEIYLPMWCNHFDCRCLENIDQYVRQYFGRKNIKKKIGKEVLYVKFISKEEIEFLKKEDSWKEHEIFVCYDGTNADYWQIMVDLKRKKCFGMYVEGIVIMHDCPN